MLILGINNDACVSALKGSGYPLQPERTRTEIVASMDCVDYVLLFDELTVDGILEELKADIHARRTDCTEENEPEREAVSAYGGRIAIIQNLKTIRQEI